MKKAFLAAASAAAFSLGAVAQQPVGPYVGVLAGTADISRDVDFGSVDETYSKNKFTWGALLGWQFHPNFAVELGYLNLGKISETIPAGTDSYDATMKATGWTASALASYPFADRWSVHARLGAVRATEKFSVSSGGTHLGSETDNTTELLYGAGVGVRLNDAAQLRLDYQRADFDAGDVGVISLGFNWLLPTWR